MKAASWVWIDFSHRLARHAGLLDILAHQDDPPGLQGQVGDLLATEVVVDEVPRVRLALHEQDRSDSNSDFPNR
jgi:hypothetical protein